MGPFITESKGTLQIGGWSLQQNQPCDVRAEVTWDQPNLLTEEGRVEICSQPPHGQTTLHNERSN